jgi:transposase-like protein
VIAGTIFAATKVPLCTWFRAMYHLTQSKGGISSIELGRRLGVTQTTAWKIKHKLMQVMMERDATKRLTGRIEIDDAYLGGERNGGKRGRGSPGKTPIVVAVETTPEGKPIRLKLRRVTGFRRAAIATLAKRNFDPASTVVSDGLRCFTGVSNAGCVHQPIITGSGRKAALNPAFKWVNTTLGNIKSAITGTYRAVRDKHIPRYLAEFEFRFNRRYDLAAMMPRLGYVAVRTSPMPYQHWRSSSDQRAGAMLLAVQAGQALGFTTMRAERAIQPDPCFKPLAGLLFIVKDWRVRRL